MNVLELDASELPAHGDLVARCIARELTGFIVRGAFDAGVTGAFLSAATREPPPFPMFDSKHFTGRTVGQVLVVSGDRLDGYFAAARRFRAALAGEGGACAGLEERFHRLFERLSGGLEVRPPRRDADDVYGPFTARELVPGGRIAAHCENETLRFPSMADLRERIDPTTQLSFYVPLQVPERGGELVLSTAEFGAGFGAELGSLDRVAPKTLEALEQRRFGVLAPGVGDLLVFDAGRYFHQVTPVEGARPRWTLGGFLAFSRGRDAVFAWG